MNPNELRSLWENEHHWGYGPLGGYFCKQDPRLFVPKRRLPGGTLNLAHALAIPILTGILGFLILLVLVMGWSCGTGTVGTFYRTSLQFINDLGLL